MLAELGIQKFLGFELINSMKSEMNVALLQGKLEERALFICL